MYSKIVERLELGVLVAERRDFDPMTLHILEANKRAREILNLDEQLNNAKDLGSYFPIVDAELRFGNIGSTEKTEVFDALDGKNYRLVISHYEDKRYIVELCHSVPASESEENHSQLIQSLKQEVLKLISKEAYLIHENEYLKRIMNELPALVAIKDHNLRYIYVNKSFAEFVKKSPKSILGKTDFDICSLQDAQSFRIKDLSIMENGHSRTYEETFTDKNGRLHHLLTRKDLIINSNGNHSIQLLSTDITELKALQEELKQSRTRYEEVAELSQYVVWMMSFDYKHSFISPSIKQFQGYEPEEFLKLDLSQSLTEEAMQRAAAIREEVLDLHQRGEYEELRKVKEVMMSYYHKDGRVLHGRVMYSVIMDDCNNLLGIQGSTIQI